LIDHRFNIVGALPHRQLPIRARAFMENFLDVRELGLTAQFLHFWRNEFEHLVK
jgi:hypothetical protein